VNGLVNQRRRLCSVMRESPLIQLMLMLVILSMRCQLRMLAFFAFDVAATTCGAYPTPALAGGLVMIMQSRFGTCLFFAVVLQRSHTTN